MDAGEAGGTARVAQDYIPLRVQRRNLILVVIDGAAIGLISAGSAFVSVLVVRLGASPLWVSLLSAVPAAIALVMTIPWSRFAERRARPQAVFAWARLAVDMVYPLLALALWVWQGQPAARVVVILWSLSAFAGSLSEMMFTLVMGHAVPADRRAFLMSRRWIFLGIAKLVATPLVSQLIAGMAFPRGYQVVFGASLAVALGAFYCAQHLSLPRRERAAPARQTASRQAAARRMPWAVRIRGGVAEVVQARPFVRFVSGRVMVNLGLGLVSAAIPIYWVRQLSVSDAWVGTFNAVLSATTLISYLPWLRVKRKWGMQGMLIASVMGCALYPALTSLARTPVALLPVVAFYGLVSSGLNLSFFDALLEVCPPQREERFVAINMTAVNLAGVVGPPVGAALLDVLHIRWVMVMATAVALGGAVVFASGVRGTAMLRARALFASARARMRDGWSRLRHRQ